MTTRKTLTITLAFAIVASLPVVAQAQNRSAEEAAAWRMQRMDTNEDGVVTFDEFQVYRTNWARDGDRDENMLRPRAIERAFGRMDSDGDGSVTMDEMIALVRRQRAGNG